MSKKHPRINLAIDLVLLTLTQNGKSGLDVLLLERDKEPEIGKWSLPGGFVYSGEDTDLNKAIHRILKNKLKVPLDEQEWNKQQVGCFYTEERDKRNVATVVYWGLIPNTAEISEKLSSNNNLKTFPVNSLKLFGGNKKLAFDHNERLRDAIEHLSETMERKNTVIKFFGEKFTTNDLRFAYETVWNYSDSTFGSKSNFIQLVKKQKTSFNISEDTEIDDEDQEDLQRGRPAINWKKELDNDGKPLKSQKLKYPFPRKNRDES
tara:strand:- start:249 stop:1037 length:789 start_codon:yes stop_codon:yes gene_type:complete